MAAKEGLKHPVLDEVARKGRARIYRGRLHPARPRLRLQIAVRRRRLRQRDLFGPVQRHGRGGAGPRRLRGQPSAPRRQEHLQRLLRPDVRHPAPAPAARAGSPSSRIASSSTSGSRPATWSGCGSRGTRRSRRSSRSMPPTRWKPASFCSTPSFRARLLELRRNGRVFVYAGA
jgi:hypothetical protein